MTQFLRALPHGADSPPIKASDISRTASKVSQSQNCTPKHILVGTLLFGIQTGRRRLTFCSNGTSEIARRCRPKPRNVVRYRAVVMWQHHQAICDVVMIGTVEFVVDRTVRVVAPERP